MAGFIWISIALIAAVALAFFWYARRRPHIRTIHADRAGPRPTAPTRARPASPRAAMPDPHSPADSNGSVEVGQYDSLTANPSVTSEIVELLARTLKTHPQRTDLRMMLLDAYARLGLVDELFAAADQAAKEKRFSARMDWPRIAGMLADAAASRALPPAVSDAVEAHAARTLLSQAAQGPGVKGAPPRRAAAPTDRRFGDIAHRICGDALTALTAEYGALRARPEFFRILSADLGAVLNRPSLLFHADTFGRAAGGGADIFLKREDQRHVTAEFEHAAAQVWTARALGRHTVVAANDVDGHATAVANVAAQYAMKAVIFMRNADAGADATIAALKALDAEVRVDEGSAGASDPREAALRYWASHAGGSFLALGMGSGPRPYPIMASDFQSLLGRETQEQLDRIMHGRSGAPMYIASVNSEADALGFLLPHLNRDEVDLVYTEPVPGTDAATELSARSRAYRGFRREHAWLRTSGRIAYETVNDERARWMQEQIDMLEGISLDLEDARALAHAETLARHAGRRRDIVVLAG